MSTPTLDAANEYHQSRLGKEQWEAQSEDRRQRALTAASDDLAQFSKSPGFAAAVFEQALWLLGDEADLAVHGVTSIGLDGMSKGYSRGRGPAHVAPKAWALVAGSGGGVKSGEIRSGRSWPCSRTF